MSLRIRAVVLTVACTALFAFAVPAFASASSPAQSAYGGQGAAQNSRSVSGATSSELPFTGLNAGLVVLVGVALLGAGLVVRRSVHTE